MVEIVVAIIVALQTIIQVIIQKIFSKKDDIESLQKLIETMKADSDKRDNEIENKFRNISLMYAKTYLIDLMSRIDSGEKINQEQIRLLYELKSVYNKARWR